VVWAAVTRERGGQRGAWGITVLYLKKEGREVVNPTKSGLRELGKVKDRGGGRTNKSTTGMAFKRIELR